MDIDLRLKHLIQTEERYDILVNYLKELIKGTSTFVDKEKLEIIIDALREED